MGNEITFAGLRPLAQDALDIESVRKPSKFGHLHITRANISKAAINEYLGREIPNWEKLGLDENRRYKLLRHPDELKKAAASFNNLPVLSVHIPHTAEDNKPETVVGSTGTAAKFGFPYLENSIVIWTAPAVRAVESGEQKQLSSAYSYRADMTPGTWNGQAYDGVMRDIVGNHVAIVREGRAGADVVIGDSKEGPTIMAKETASIHRYAAIMAAGVIGHIAPLLAQDATLDVKSVFGGLTAENYEAKKPGIITALTEQTKGKLATDAKLDNLPGVLDALHKQTDLLKEPVADPKPKVEGAADSGGPGCKDDDDEETDKDGKKKKKPMAADMITKPAMDAAIAAAVEKNNKDWQERAQAIREAEQIVRPYVGDLAMAHDSAEGVYKTALGMMGVKVEGVHPSAFKTILELQPKPGSKQPERQAMAHDVAAASDFAKRFPGVDSIRLS